LKLVSDEKVRQWGSTGLSALHRQPIRCSAPSRRARAKRAQHSAFSALKKAFRLPCPAAPIPPQCRSTTVHPNRSVLKTSRWFPGDVEGDRNPSNRPVEQCIGSALAPCPACPALPCTDIVQIGLGPAAPHTARDLSVRASSLSGASISRIAS